jgi:hypothetical protein
MSSGCVIWAELVNHGGRLEHDALIDLRQRLRFADEYADSTKKCGAGSVSEPAIRSTTFIVSL